MIDVDSLQDEMDALRNITFVVHVSKQRRSRCQCGDDLPGSCPGVANCPYSDEGEEE